MKLDALLRAHEFMRIERPPELWEADTEDVRLIPLLGEMIAAVLSRGTELGETTLNASNVVVERDESEDEPQIPAPGEYVALTVRGKADLGPDDRWHPGAVEKPGLLGDLRERLSVAGVRFAYVRRLPGEGSLTIFLSRLQDCGVELPHSLNRQ